MCVEIFLALNGRQFLLNLLYISVYRARLLKLDGSEIYIEFTIIRRSLFYPGRRYLWIGTSWLRKQLYSNFS